jgi:HSP20 family protein
MYRLSQHPVEVLRTLNMNTELKNWNQFKFLRRSSQERASAPSMTSPDGKHSLLKCPDLHRRFLTDAWRAMNDWLNEAFFGELDRWFSDCSSPWFQPRIEVVDDGKTLRITAEQPGMNWEDIQTSVEAGASVICGENKPT